MASSSDSIAGTIQVVLIDDHALVREGLEGALRSQPDISVVASFNSGEEAIRAIRALPAVDVILLDVRLPDTDGISLIPAFRVHQPRAAIVILSSDGRHAAVERAMDAGANGFLLKSIRMWDLINSIRKVATKGSLPLPTELRPQNRMPASERPTAKELIVLRHLANGLSNEQISVEMDISLNTVKTHVAHVLAKLGAESRTDALVRASRLGFIDL